MISVNQLTSARKFILNGDKNYLEHREEITHASFTHGLRSKGGGLLAEYAKIPYIYRSKVVCKGLVSLNSNNYLIINSVFIRRMKNLT